jgi:hypothetical protein
MYTVQTLDKNGGNIENRHRPHFLFEQGFWNGLCKNMPAKEKEDLRRVVFFQGTLVYSARRIPELDPEHLPMELLVDPQKAEGDSIKICGAFHFVTPTELAINEPAINDAKKGDVTFDMRCSDCTRCFTDPGSLMQHW